MRGLELLPGYDFTASQYCSKTAKSFSEPINVKALVSCSILEDHRLGLYSFPLMGSLFKIIASVLSLFQFHQKS